MAPRRRRWAGMGATLLMLACGREPEPAPGRVDDGEQTPAPTWTMATGLLYSGCDAVYLDGRCTLDDSGPLVVWVPDAVPEAIAIELDDRPLAASEVTAIAGGVRLRAALASIEGVHTLAIFDERTHRRWQLGLQGSEMRLRDEAYVAGMKLARAAEHEQAIASMRAAVADASPEKRLQFESGISRIQLAQADHAGALATTRAVYEAAIPLGRVDIANAAASRAVYIRTFLLPDYEAAQTWLERIPDDPSVPSTAAYQRGLLAWRLADLRSAERAFEEAVVLATPLGHPGYLHQAHEMLAQTAAQAGRTADVELHCRAALDLALAEPDRPCRVAHAWTNVGWAWTLLLAEDLPGEDPRPALNRAIEGFSSDTCDNPRELANARLSLAHVELLQANPQGARAQIDAVDASQLEPWQRSWLPLLEGDLHVASGHPREALKAHESAEALARLGDDGDLQWRALVGQANDQAALGARQRALDLHARAESLLERLVARVALDAGREMFLAGRERVAGNHVALALDSGLNERAACVAARTLARPYRLVERRRSWAPHDERLPALIEYRTLREQLEASRAEDWNRPRSERVRVQRERAEQIEQMHALLDQAFGELEPAAAECAFRGRRLILFPLARGPEGERWVSFLHDSGEVLAALVTREPEMSDAQLAQALIDPHAERLAATTDITPPRLTIQAHPRVRGLPFEPVQIAGERLDRRFALAYDRGSDSASAAPEARVALVVSDPSGNLQHARHEAAQIVNVLTDVGWEVEHLSGEGVTAGALAAGLERATLFHYAGHASTSGVAGWDSQLPIAGGDHFDVHDVLALQRVPSFVILSGCETGGSIESGDGWNIAQAFVTAGAHAVIASTAVIDDEDAAIASMALIEHLDLEDGAGTLWTARRALDGAAADAFRVWERPAADP